MAKTVSLTSLDRVWVTTYYAGERGTCFDISMQLDAETQVTRTFTLQELLDTLKVGGRVRGLAKPAFDMRFSSCPSQSAQGREDRCGLFSSPPRCSVGACSMSDQKE